MKIKRKLKEKLIGSSFYWKYFRDSGWRRRWITIRNTDLDQRLTNEEVFYTKLFKDFGIERVFDVGANNGDKTALFLDSGASFVLSVEADPHWVPYLNWRFESRREVRVESAAVSDSGGNKVFYRFEPGSYLNTLEPKWVEEMGSDENRFHQKRQVSDSVEIVSKTFGTLVESYKLPDYAKIDVEGHELEVVKGMEDVPKLVSLEFNLPEFRRELSEVVDLICQRRPESKFNYVCDYGDGFVLTEWLSGSEVLKSLHDGEVGYAELFVRST